jgi:hypothetical protein
MEPEQHDGDLGGEQQPLDSKTPRDLPKVLAAWSPDDIGRFFALVDCDWEAQADDPTQHMVFRPEHAPHYMTERHGGVERPLYRVGARYYDARRIASILFNGEDPQASGATLTMACGHQFCVHPRHIELVPRRNKGHGGF